MSRKVLNVEVSRWRNLGNAGALPEEVSVSVDFTELSKGLSDFAKYWTNGTEIYALAAVMKALWGRV